MKRVLIVDDDVSVVTLLKKRIEVLGHAVISAADGVEGLRLIRAQQPDLVILDIMMPGMDGFSVIREIKSDEACRGIPLMIITAKTDMDELFRMEGVQAVFVKPFEGDAVIQKVQALLA